jgi:hypothetical protein
LVLREILIIREAHTLISIGAQPILGTICSTKRAKQRSEVVATSPGIAAKAGAVAVFNTGPADMKHVLQADQLTAKDLFFGVDTGPVIVASV